MTTGIARPSARPVLGPPPALDPARDALFLDFDGTLVAIAARPDGIRPAPHLAALLRRTGNLLAGRLVIVTGRALADLDHHLGESMPLAAGIHGADVRGLEPLDGRGARVRQAVEAALARLAPDAGGLLVEDKGLALALHYRERPALGALAGRLAAELADASGGLLAVQPGRMVFELKPAACDKGRVVTAFLRDARFAGSRPVFVGDDLTDEAGFRAATAAGGYGILVGQRPSAAAHALADVAAVHRWLGSEVP